MLRRYITVRDQYEGFHRWVDAPKAEEFLRNEHRHLFKWETTIEVMHDNRDLEFFAVKRQLNTDIAHWLRVNKWRDLGSCEMQAEKILGFIHYWYGDNRSIQVRVSEDGESDGVVNWHPDN